MTNKDPYEILGVPRNATQEEIKRAYRRLAKQTHPDHNPGNPHAEQRFKEVQAAYELLGDPKRRAEYDRFGAGGPAPEFRTWTTGTAAPFADGRFDFGTLGDLSSIFEQFFTRGMPGDRGGRTRRAARTPRPRGPDLDHEVELTFEEALRGARRELVLTEAAHDGHTERIEVRIPPGVRDGQRIRVRDKGQPGAGGRGDLYIRCRLRPHPVFRLEGRDVVLDLPLTFAEATLGTKVEVPTPDGPTLVTVPPGTSSGTKLRLRGRGLPAGTAGEGGDLLAIVRIVSPRSISPRARQLLEELDRELGHRPRTGWPP